MMLISYNFFIVFIKVLYAAEENSSYKNADLAQKNFYELFRKKIISDSNKEDIEIKEIQNQDFFFMTYHKYAFNNKKMLRLIEIFQKFNGKNLFISSFSSSTLSESQNYKIIKETLNSFISYSGTITENSEYFKISEIMKENNPETFYNSWGHVFLTKSKRFVENNDYTNYIKSIFLRDSKLKIIPFKKRLSDLIFIRDNALNRFSMNFITYFLYKMICTQQRQKKVQLKKILTSKKTSLKNIFADFKWIEMEDISLLINEFFYKKLNIEEDFLMIFLLTFLEEQKYLALKDQNFRQKYKVNHKNYSSYMKKFVFDRKKEIFSIFKNIKKTTENLEMGFICILLTSEKKELLKSIMDFYLKLKTIKYNDPKNFYAYYIDSSKKEIIKNSKDSTQTTFEITKFKGVSKVNKKMTIKLLKIHDNCIILQSYISVLQFSRSSIYTSKTNTNPTRTKSIIFILRNFKNKILSSFSLRFYADYLVLSNLYTYIEIYYYKLYENHFYNTFLLIYTAKNSLLYQKNHFMLKFKKFNIMCTAFEDLTNYKMGYYFIYYSNQLSIRRSNLTIKIRMFIQNLEKFLSLNTNSINNILYRPLIYKSIFMYDVIKPNFLTNKYEIFRNINEEIFPNDIEDHICKKTEVQGKLVTPFSSFKLKITDINGNIEKYYFYYGFNDQKYFFLEFEILKNFIEISFSIRKIRALVNTDSIGFFAKYYIYCFSKILRIFPARYYINMCIFSELNTFKEKIIYLFKFHKAKLVEVMCCIYIKRKQNNVFISEKNSTPNTGFTHDDVLYKLLFYYDGSFNTFLLNFFNKKKEKGEISFLSSKTFKITNSDLIDKNGYDIKEFETVANSTIYSVIENNHDDIIEFEKDIKNSFLEQQQDVRTRYIINDYDKIMKCFFSEIMDYFSPYFINIIEKLVNVSNLKNYKCDKIITFTSEVKMKENYLTRTTCLLHKFLSEKDNYDSSYVPKNYTDELSSVFTNKSNVWNIQ